MLELSQETMARLRAYAALLGVEESALAEKILTAEIPRVDTPEARAAALAEELL